MANQSFDVVIVGGGQAGIPLANALAEAGWSVALAERAHLGGSCVNFGCTPTKAAIASARLAHQARRAGEFGLVIPHVGVDFPAVIARARGLAEASRSHLEAGFQGSGNPLLLRGHARFEGRTGDRFRLRVGDTPIDAAQVVLNTGTRALIPELPGLASLRTLTSDNWLDSSELPAHLAVIGGGYIGLEIGQFYRRMGSRVTIIEHGPQIAGHEDPDVAEALQAFLAAEGIEFRTHTDVLSVAANGAGVTLTLAGAGAGTLEASTLFVATARRPNTDALGLDTIGLALGPHGTVPVDERLATPVAGVWAAGDIRGGAMFTHTAWDDYRILASQLLGDRSRTTDRVVPYALFTDPELGRVGLTEAEARKTGQPIAVGRFDFADNGKAKELGETRGWIKVVVNADSHQILGAAVLGPEGSELVHLFIDLMNAHAPSDVMARAIHIHPTLAEAVQSAVSAIPHSGARVSWAPAAPAPATTATWRPPSGPRS